MQSGQGEEIHVKEPEASLEKCFQNKADIRGFGDNLCADTEKNRVLYDEYACKYDKIQEVTGFNDPAQIVRSMIKHNIDKSVKIADFGCGTDILGQDLAAYGYRDVIGIDSSNEMLKVAMARTHDGSPVYKSSALHMLASADDTVGDLAPGSLDLIVSSACMIKGHFPNSCFELFLKYLKPGCLMIFSIRDIYINSETDSGMNYHGAMAALEEAGKM